MSKIVKTTTASGIGFLGGILLERGLETLTGVDFIDGVFAVGGAALAALSVNREMLQTATKNIQQMFGKDPLHITEEEWHIYKTTYPKTAALLEEALKV